MKTIENMSLLSGEDFRQKAQTKEQVKKSIVAMAEFAKVDNEKYEL